MFKWIYLSCCLHSSVNCRNALGTTYTHKSHYSFEPGCFVAIDNSLPPNGNKLCDWQCLEPLMDVHRWDSLAHAYRKSILARSYQVSSCLLRPGIGTTLDLRNCHTFVHCYSDIPVPCHFRSKSCNCSILRKKEGYFIKFVFTFEFKREFMANR